MVLGDYDFNWHSSLFIVSSPSLNQADLKLFKHGYILRSRHFSFYKDSFGTGTIHFDSSHKSLTSTKNEVFHYGVLQ